MVNCVTERIEIYRPHPDNDRSFNCITLARNNLQYFMIGARPGTFAIVIRIDGTEETVLERWRVDAKGRILRAVFDVRERELEQP